MITQKEIIYYPALRFKQGECNALKSLAPEIRDHLCPRLILPPPKESVDDGEAAPTPDGFAYVSGKALGQFWPGRICFLEPRFLLKEFGGDGASVWLPRLFQVARMYNAQPVPLASLDEAVGPAADGLKAAIDVTANTKMSFRVCFADLTDDLPSRITEALEKQGVRSENCVVFLDFADADLSEPSTISEFISGAMLTLQELGVWKRIVFQGTNFPEKNPGVVGKLVQVKRTEWQAWSDLVKVEPAAFQGIAFGDYSADSAKFQFGGSGGVPIRHLRYCGTGTWLISRGDAAITQNAAMRNAAQKIVGSEHFMGRTFSSFDEHIYQMSNGMVGCGGAALWRELNIGHHITKVMYDLAAMYKLKLQLSEISKAPEQFALFAE